MADGDWIERAITRVRSANAEETHEIVRTLFVYGYGPHNAYENANPPLPRIGSIFPFDSVRSLITMQWLGFRIPRLITFRSNYAEHKDVAGAEVHLVYGVAPMLYDERGNKYVQWESRGGVEMETVTHDLEGKIIPNGGTTSIPVEIITARLIGWVKQEAHSYCLGCINDRPFRNWPTGYVKFDGAISSLLDGYDVESYGATVELVFRAKRGSWNERRPILLPDGTALPGEYGLLETEYPTHHAIDFRILFPSGAGWRTGLESGPAGT